MATGVAWSVQQHVSTTIVTSNAVTPHPVLIGQAFTALLVGLDARTDANGNPLPPALLDAIHAGPDEGQLHTDTIILLHVPALPGEPAVAISIPRDSYVPLADGSGKHKINSAYNRGLVAAEKDLKAQGVSGPELDRRGREAGRRPSSPPSSRSPAPRSTTTPRSTSRASSSSPTPSAGCRCA